MPWKIHLLEAERRRFIGEALARRKSIAQLCREFGISRKTGFKWLRRFHRAGQAGLTDRSRRPRRSPRRLSLRWQSAISALRKKHPRWGAKKIGVQLRRQNRWAPLPCERTIGRWLKRLGWLEVRPLRSRRGPILPRATLTKPTDCHQVWTVDFKGWFRTRDGQRVEPLTVRDLFSRYVLAIDLLTNQADAAVRRKMHQLFRKHGLPKIIRVDHGAPFSGVGALDLSRLSVWWIRLGIRVEFTRRGCPQDNGAHEQMHRVYKAEATCPPAATIAGQQQRTARWIKQYNHVRPHEGLGQRVPATLYRRNRRVYRGQLKRSVYARHWLQRKVTSRGFIFWNGRRRMVGRAFGREVLGFKQAGPAFHEVYLDKQLIGLLYDHDLGGMRAAKWSKVAEQPSKP